MKKIIPLSLLTVSFLLVTLLNSCKEDEPKDLIIGTWVKNSDNTISIFQEGGTCIVSGVNGTWSIAGNSLTVIFPTLGNGPKVFTIVSISESTMVLRFANETDTITYTKQ